MNEFFRFAIKLGSQALASKFAESIAEEFLKTRPSLTEQHKGIVNNLLREALAK